MLEALADNKPDKGKHQHIIRNLPDIDTTPAGKFELDQENNFFSTGGVSNTSIDYGTANGWDIGIDILNAGFFSLPSATWYFQPDILFTLEKHWDWWQGKIILGTQSGMAFLPQGKRFAEISHIDYQQTLDRFDIDFDLGIYYANTVMAGRDSVGVHLNLELPIYDDLRINGDYLSGNNGLGGSTVKLLYPFADDWNIGLGVQIPNVYQGDHFIGLLGIYSR